MQLKWIFRSTLLPMSKEPVEFLVEERGQSIHGTFANCIFHSRWADYDARRVVDRLPIPRMRRLRFRKCFGQERSRPC
jgi:hypothetical protein